MRIIYFDNGMGWQSITHMVNLAAEMFSADLTVFTKSRNRKTYLEKLSRIQKRGNRGDCCLLIVPSASYLDVFYEIKGWRSSFGFVAAWVIDSFWAERFPWYTRYLGHIDHYFVTNPEEVDAWAISTRTPVTCLPWGSDVLRLGSASPVRDIDLLRVGRQPPGWDDDESNVVECENHGVRYQGRPPLNLDDADNQKKLLAVYARSKLALSFSNIANPTAYTHPTRHYITARWCDSLAAGASVVGIHPQCEVIHKLFWEGALIELSTLDRDRGLAEIIDVLRAWNPSQVERNFYGALRNLDWRWRFKVIAKLFEINTPTLDLEFQKITSILQK